MIITRSDRIIAVDRIWIAVISSAFTEPLQEGWKKLPFRSKPQPPHPVTGLWKECVLKCDWRKSIEKAEPCGAVSSWSASSWQPQSLLRAGFEQPDAALYLLHEFDELHLTLLAGFHILNQDNVTELLKANDLSRLC